MRPLRVLIVSVLLALVGAGWSWDGVAFAHNQDPGGAFPDCDSPDDIGKSYYWNGHNWTCRYFGGGVYGWR